MPLTLKEHERLIYMWYCTPSASAIGGFKITPTIILEIGNN